MKWIAIAAVILGAVLVVWRVRSDDAPSDEVVAVGPARWPSPDELRGVHARLVGRVIDDTARPVAGARVAIIGRRDRGATSDAKGAFALEGLEPGAYRLVAATDALVSEPVIARLSDSSKPVTIRVGPAGAIDVKVIAEAGEQAIAGATVTDVSGRTTTTDADGNATIRGVGPQFTDVHAWAPGFARASAVSSIHAGRTARITIALPRGAAVGGTIVGPDGAPIAGGRVHLANRFDTTADAAGAWTLEGVPIGTYQVTASTPFGIAAPFALAVDGSAPKRGVVVRVALGAQLVGTIVDASGAPVSGATVELARTRWSTATTTDGAGRFALFAVPAGSSAIWARHGARASRELMVELVDKQRTEVIVTLGESSIAGRVIDGTGAPLANAQVIANPQGEEGRLTGDDVTNARGEFDLGGVPPGEHELRVRLPDATFTEPVTAKAGDRTVTITARSR